MRTDTLSRDTSTCFEALEEPIHAILRQWLAGFREKEVIFSCTAPFRKFLLIRTMFVQVVAEVAQTVLSQSDAPLLRSFPQYGHNSLFAINIADAQIDQFGNAMSVS